MITIYSAYNGPSAREFWYAECQKCNWKSGVRLEPREICAAAGAHAATTHSRRQHAARDTR